MPKIILIISIVLAVVPALIWATGLETFSGVRLLVFFGPFLLVIFLILLKRRPAWTAFSILLALMPIIGLIMPPARLSLTAFHYLALLLLLLGMQAGNDARRVAFFARNLRIFWLPLLLLAPTVLFAVNIQRSAMEWAAMWGYYATVVVGLHYLSDRKNLITAHFLLVTSLAIISVAILVQKFAGVSFAWLYGDRGTEIVSGVLIKRGSGLFQDPQKAGQVIAMLTTYLTVLWQRRALPAGWARILTPIAIALALPALFLTVSRLAIASGMFFFLVGFLILGRQAIPVRVIARVCAGGILVAGALMWGNTEMINLLPSELQSRALAMDESMAARLGIWVHSFHIYMDHPLTGIGPGNYQQYFLMENPGYPASQGGFGPVLIPDQPESGYLKILYEVGTLGSLAILWFAGNMARLIIANIHSPVPDIASRGWAVAVAMGVFLVTFTTLFTTSDSRNAFLPVLFLTLAYADRLRDIQGLTTPTAGTFLRGMLGARSRSAPG